MAHPAPTQQEDNNTVRCVPCVLPVLYTIISLVEIEESSAAVASHDIFMCSSSETMSDDPGNDLPPFCLNKVSSPLFIIRMMIGWLAGWDLKCMRI